MIDLETVARIRQLHYGEHWLVGTLAEALGLHHETVQRALSDTPRARPAPKPSLFDPYGGFVLEVLERYPRLTATRLWHMLRERGCPLSVRQVRDKVACLRPSKREAFLIRRTFPGEEGQVDWASFGHVMIGAARRALSAFLLTLTFSRWFFLRFFLDQSLENFLRGHVYAFGDLHGVPRYCLYETSALPCPVGAPRLGISQPATLSSAGRRSNAVNGGLFWPTMLDCSFGQTGIFPTWPAA